MKKPLLTLAASALAMLCIAGTNAPITVNTNNGQLSNLGFSTGGQGLFWSNSVTGAWGQIPTNSHVHLTDEHGTVYDFHTNGTFAIVETNGVCEVLSNGSLILSSNLTASNTITAAYFVGNGSGLTGITGFNGNPTNVNTNTTGQVTITNIGTVPGTTGTASNALHLTGGGSGNALTNTTNFVFTAFTNSPWFRLQTNWGWIDYSNNVVMDYASNGIFYAVDSIQTLNASIGSGLSVGSVNGGGGNLYGKFNFYGDNQGDSLLTFSQYGGGNSALLDQNINFTLNGGAMSATHYIGSTAGYTGTVVNAAYTAASSQPIFYVGNGSDFGCMVAFSNTWSGWAHVGNAYILFTNYYSTPFASTPVCFIGDVNGNFSFDTANDSSFDPDSLLYLANLSTPSYGVFGFSDANGALSAPSMATAPWIFSIIKAGGNKHLIRAGTNQVLQIWTNDALLGSFSSAWPTVANSPYDPSSTTIFTNITIPAGTRVNLAMFNTSSGNISTSYLRYYIYGNSTN